MAKIVVNKPFRFNRPIKEGQPLTQPQTVHFDEPGEYEVDDEVANHPWIKDGADGAITKASDKKAETRKIVAPGDKKDDKPGGAS